VSKANSEPRKWIDDVEFEDVAVKWAFSHFDGREDLYNGQGDHNFTIILPDDVAKAMSAEGWNVVTKPGYEEGDPEENLLKVKISYKFEPPKIYLIKGERKIRAEERDLADIRRDTCEQLDVILTPSRWVHGGNTGITAYAKELYARIKESRFSAKYADYEEL
jgi:hypothetical protein